MIVLLPTALFFLASFLLTRRWYVRAGSVPGLILAAIVQPLVTAAMFSTGMDLIGQARTGSPSSGFAAIFLAAAIFTVVLATPIALLSCMDPIRRIRLQDPKQLGETQDISFVVLMMAGLISLTCAGLAIATIYPLIELIK